MPKGYWIALVDVQDPDRYQTYRAAVGPALLAFGGRFVVRGGTAILREGAVKQRVVVVEFASLAEAPPAMRARPISRPRRCARLPRFPIS